MIRGLKNRLIKAEKKEGTRNKLSVAMDVSTDKIRKMIKFNEQPKQHRIKTNIIAYFEKAGI